MQDANARQLALIQEIGGELRRAGIRFWLRGGWALDFHLGRVSRSHADIDLATWLRHRARIRSVLTSCGFSELAGYRPPQLVLSKHDQEVSFLFLTRHKDQITVPGYEAWPFPSGSFPNRIRKLSGVGARVASTEELLFERENYTKWRDTPMRPKDRESIRLIRQLRK